MIIVSFIDLSYFWHFDVLFGPKWPHFRNSQVKFLQHPCPDSWPLDLRISSISTTYESLIFWLNFLILEIWMHTLFWGAQNDILYLTVVIYMVTLFDLIWQYLTSNDHDHVLKFALPPLNWPLRVEWAISCHLLIIVFFYLHMILEICMHKQIWVAQNIPKGRTPILHISNLAIFFYLPIVLFIFCPFLTVWRYFWPIWPFMTPK